MQSEEQKEWQKMYRISEKIEVTIKCARSRRERERGRKIFKKVMTYNFPNLMKTTKLYIQDSWQTLMRISMKRSTPRHVVKILKDKKMWKAARENWLSSRGAAIKLTPDFSWKTGGQMVVRGCSKVLTESSALQNCLSEVKVKWKHFQVNENRIHC